MRSLDFTGTEALTAAHLHNMIKKIVYIITILSFNSNIALKGQINSEDICKIYSQIIYELKDSIKNQEQKNIYVVNKLIITDDFVKYLKASYPLFENELEKREIDYKKFINKTDDINISTCFNNDIKLISEGAYREKYKKYRRKSIGICFFSNIGYYNNIAFVKVTVELSYGRRYSNFYFFRKETDWKLIFSKLEND